MRPAGPRATIRAAAALRARREPVPPLERRLAFVRRLALVAAVVVLAVTSLSAYLRLARAGLGCADWPACYGQGLRELQQGIPPAADAQGATAAARFAHRVAAVLALLLVVTMLMTCFTARPLLRREGALAIALLVLALLLAVLGRWSSAARVPAVAIGNLLGGFLMLGLCVRLAGTGRPAAAPPPAWRAWLLAALALLLVQIALGGLVSASYAGLACRGWADCGLVDTWRLSGWGSLDPWREPLLDGVSASHPAGAFAHSLHRHGALLLAALLLPLGVGALRRGQRRSGAALLALLVLQGLVGVVMTAAGLPLAAALLHNLLAAGLLAALLSLR